MSDTYFRGKRVSGSWAVVLNRAGRVTSFRLNSGRRTIQEQWYFYNNQPPPAAYPNPRAPHIDQGNESHALDVNQTDHGVYRLAAVLRRWGMIARWTVRGEPWHIEVAEGELRAAARRFRRSGPRTVKRHSSGKTVRRLQRILRARGFKSVPGRGQKGHGYFGRTTASAVKRVQRKHGLRADGVCGPRTWKVLT